MMYRVWQKSGLCECGWEGSNMDVIIYTQNLSISPKIVYDVLEYDIVIVMLQNYILMIL